MSTELEDLKSHFKTHDRVREISAHSAKVHSVDWNFDGRRLASGSFDKTVCIFSIEHDRLVSVIFSSHLIDVLKLYRSNWKLFQCLG